MIKRLDVLLVFHINGTAMYFFQFSYEGMTDNT